MGSAAPPSPNPMPLKTPASALLLSSILLLSAGCATDSRQPSPAAAEMRQDEIGFLIREATAWVKAQRERHRPNARELTREEKQPLAGFFPPEILNAARVKEVRKIENPAFFSVYTGAGKPVPLDFSRAAGLTLIDTILITRSSRPLSSPSGLPLLLHELVHVVQNRVLGTDQNLDRYIRSWAEGGRRYRSIAFEDQAFELQNRFRANPREAFSVWEEVERRFGRASAR